MDSTSFWYAHRSLAPVLLLGCAIVAVSLAFLVLRAEEQYRLWKERHSHGCPSRRAGLFFTVIVFLLSTVLLHPLPVSAGTFTQVECQMILQNGKGKPQLNAVVNVPLTRSLMLTGFGLYQHGDKEWSQGRVGLAWSPVPELQFGSSAGMEQHDGLWRTGFTLRATPGNLASFSVYEKGAGGTWYKSVTTIPVAARTRLGLFGQKFAGWGLVAEHKLAHGKIWATELLRSNESPTVIIGVDVAN